MAIEEINKPGNLATQNYIRSIVPSVLNKKPGLSVVADSWGNYEDIGTSSYSRGIGRAMNAYLSNFFSFNNVYPGSGETVAQMRARFNAEFISNTDQYGLLICGVNSLKNGVSAASMLADYEAMIDEAINAGKILMVTPPQPGIATFQTGIVTQADVESRLLQYNLLIRGLNKLQVAKSGWIFLSETFDGVISTDYVDPSFGIRCPVMGLEYAIRADNVASIDLDRNHPGAPLAQKAGKNIATKLSQILVAANVFPNHDSDLSRASNNPLQLVSGTGSSNGILVAPGAGTFTGTVPQGFMARIVGSVAATTGVISQIAHPKNKAANLTRFIGTGFENGTSFELRESDPAAFNYTNSFKSFAELGYQVGDQIEFYAEVALHSINPGAQINTFNFFVEVRNAAGSAVIATVQANRSGGSRAEDYIARDMSDELMTIASKAYTVTDVDHQFFYRFIVQTRPVNNDPIVASNFTLDHGRTAHRKIN